MDWSVIVDLKYHFTWKGVMMLTTQHQDLLIWSVYSKTVYFIELTISFVENTDWAHQDKLKKLKKHEVLQEQNIKLKKCFD